MNPESMLKGRMAETLVEELLRQSGNIVYRFGYEAIVQNMVQLENNFDRFSEVGKKIRSIPDFIVIDKQGKPEFVEVKFRWRPQLHERDHEQFSRMEQLWGAKLIIVNCYEKPYFRISESPYFSGKELVAKPLTEAKNWNIEPKFYQTHEELVRRYLSPTMIPPDKKD